MQTIPIDGNEALVRMALKEPVALMQGDEEVAVVLCKPDYDRMRGKNVERLNRYCAEVSRQAKARGMTEEILKEILESDD